ncbi:MAG: hypothetical protein EHM85_18085 [Desulfobacteraceae bacterium]|nr:MAG: hypothetical protein EHM85_18085 [Desulfobacteraceae bacterium]
MDKTAPGGVYLCQVNENVACGACCGLYNVPDLSRERLSRMLSERTEAFMKVPREIDAILEFGKDVSPEENSKRPFPEFHHCPYIGLIGKKRMRPGCLLHPESCGNNGIDYRGLSYYGSMTCNIYFCPSYTTLPENHKRIIRESSQDWYSYGLIITETALIDSFLSEIERRAGKMAFEKNICVNQDVTAAVREFINLKISWPFRPQSVTPANYFFKDRLYEKKKVDYACVNAESVPCCHDTIFREFGSCFRSDEDVRKAVIIIESIMKRLQKGADDHEHF